MYVRSSHSERVSRKSPPERRNGRHRDRARRPTLSALESAVDGALLDQTQAADYLKTNERHIRRLWQERRLAAVKVGRYVRFAREDLDAYKAANRIEAIR